LTIDKNNLFAYNFDKKKKRKVNRMSMESIEVLLDREGVPEVVQGLIKRGRRILIHHMYQTSRFTYVMKINGATPFARRAFNYAVVPGAAVRVYCGTCGKVRSLLVIPAFQGMEEVELRASCRHILQEAVEASVDGRLVCVEGYRVVPAGIAKMLGLRVIG